MTAVPQRARHRAARRPITPLDDLATAATESLATVGRRSAVVASSAGLVMTMAVPAAAAPAESPQGGLVSVDTAALTAQARVALATSPVVSVPTDAAWTFDAPKIEVKANPKPEPEPEPVVERRSEAASRSTERESAPKAASSNVPQTVSGNAVLEIAARYVGVPYVHGGTSPDGFDCSGFTQYVYAQLGISLSRTSSGQKGDGVVVSRADAQPGDLIWSPGHIAIYAGGNQQIDSPRPGKSVQFREIWQSNPVFIRVTG